MAVSLNTVFAVQSAMNYVYAWILLLLPKSIEDRPTAHGAFRKRAPDNAIVFKIARIGIPYYQTRATRYWHQRGDPAQTRQADSKLLHCTSLANKFSVQHKFGPLHQLSFRSTRDHCKDKEVLKTITLGKQPGPQHLMTP